MSTSIQPAANSAGHLSPAKRLLLQKMQEQKRAAEAARLPITVRGDTTRWPLSYSQRRLWFIDRLEGPSAAYSMPLALRIGGAFDAQAALAAIDDIVARHEILRSRIIARDGEPYQDLVAAEPPRLIDVSGEADPEAAMFALVAREAAHVFRLEQGGLFRACLIQLADEDHALLLNMHHIVSDGWSMSVCLGELFQHYAARREGRAAPLAPLPIQYADYADWQTGRGAPMLARQVEYWRRTLAGAPALLDLPLSRARSADAGAQAGVVECRLAGDDLRALDALCREESATPFMVLLAVWYALLARLSGQSDLVVGTPVANRSRPELEPLIGFFANTLALRCVINGRLGFRALLRSVKDASLASYDHQDVPFDRLVEELNPVRSLSHSPVFQAMFAFQNAHLAAQPAVDALGLCIRPFAAGARMAKFDLTLNVAAVDDGLSCEFIYRSALFDRDAIERTASCYRSMLRDALSTPDRAVCDLPLFPMQNYFAADAAWRGPILPPAEGTALGFFAECVADNPASPAVVDAARTFSYRELDHASNRFANWLRAQGVGLEVPVAVCLERGADVAIAFLGVLKAGGVYVPLPPTLPDERARQVLASVQPAMIVTEDSLRTQCATHADVALVCIDATDALWRDAADAPPKIALPPDALSYVIFTSGSTGLPKGVQLTHRGLHNLAAWQRGHFGLGRGDRVLQFSSLGFDASVWEMVMALCTGAALHFATDDARMPGGGLERTLLGRGITAATLPPSVLSLLDADAFPALRCVVSAGEACGQDLLQRWSRQRAFFNAYGPSETTVCATSTMAVVPGETPVTIGRPINHFSAHVLDEAMQPAPVGCFGELYVGGIGLARGYCRQSGITAERFVPDPFSAEPGARLYRTGDIVRRLEDGRIEFRGRSDHQVKLRGFRIELGEIEHALLAVPGVREVCAIPRLRDDGQPESIAAFVTCDDPSLTALDLHGRLSQLLPDYMRPAAIVVLPEMPLTANIKIDRDALARLPVAPMRGSSDAAPATPTELRVAALWCALLDLPEAAAHIGRHDDFFALGGHSLLAVKLLDRIRAEFALSLPLSELYRLPLLAELAERIDRGDLSPPLVRLGRDDGPCLFLVHSVDGDIEPYLPLAARLPTYATFALRQSSDDANRADIAIGSIAAQHVASIRSQQPFGPYRIAGWSFGGMVALEIAAQLNDAGETVEFLGLIDSGVPPLEGIDATLTADVLMSRLLAEHGEIALARLVGLDEALLLGDSPHARQSRRLAAANVTALLSYAPRHAPVALHYFHAMEQSAQTLHAKLASVHAHAGQTIRCHAVPGGHRSMLREPHVESLARALVAAINEASRTRITGPHV